MTLILAAVGGAVGSAVADEPDTPAATNKCGHSHARTSALRGVRSTMRQPTLTKRDGARAWHYVKCTRTDRSYRIVRRELLRLKTWRRSYGGYWTLQRRVLSPGMMGTLARLRGCETRGIPFPANYRNAGHHFGAYQYAISTWQRAQGWAGVPGRYRTWGPHVAAPAHQDVVTARFFPAHRSEWACSA